MLLCIDGGNSRIKIALMDRGRLIAFHASPRKPRERLTCRRLMPSCLRREAKRLEGAVVATVVPELVSILASLAEEASGAAPLVVTSKVELPFAVGVRDPARVGSDRLAAAAGAAGHVKSGAIIIDIGSAITVDLLSEGIFKGGIIMAGPGLSLRALGEHTARLPMLSLPASKSPFAAGLEETAQSMVLGAGIGALGAVKEAVREIERRENRRMTVYVTGGGADRLAPRMPFGWRRRPYLVMEGLYAIWNLNNP
ncbi:MAG: type III pantothenate kinase [Chitinivibrionia bacterium]|nr:type III pantothenate kinase [Chitinivibrionia bacterium]